MTARWNDPGSTRSPEHRAKIAAALREANRASRAAAVNGVTLADLHAQGVYLADAERIMGWSRAKIAGWERDTGLRFTRMPREERARRASLAAKQRFANLAPGERLGFQNPATLEKARAAQQAKWAADPEAYAAMVARRSAKRAETISNDPAALEAIRANFARHDAKRRAAFTAMLNEPGRREQWGQRMRQVILDLYAGPEGEERRRAIGNRVREQRRLQKIARLTAKLNARTITEDEARDLVRAMTAEERMLWVMQHEVHRTNDAMKAAEMVDRRSPGWRAA